LIQCGNKKGREKEKKNLPIATNYTLKNIWQVLLSIWQVLKLTRKFSFWVDIQSNWKVTCRFEKYIVDFFDNSLILELSNRHPKLSFDFERNRGEILKWDFLFLSIWPIFLSVFACFIHHKKLMQVNF
jgi:hypothetical protein